MPSASPASPSARGRRHPRPLVAALLSVVVPGLGQLYAGRRRRGWVFIAITAAIVIPAGVLLVFVVFVRGLGLALTLSRPFFEHPGLLLLLLGINAVLLVFRVAAVLDAYLVCAPVPGDRTSRTTGIAILVGMAMLVAVVVVPHVWSGRRNLLLYDLLTYDFVSDPGQATLPSTTATSGAATTATSSPEPSSTTTGASTTTVAGRPAAFGVGGRVNILLLGGDAGVGRQGIRTDTMTVVSVDPDTGWTAMFGIPRNLIQVPIPPDSPAHDAWDCPGGCFPLIANEIYQWGLQRPDLFPGANSGATAVKEILGHLLGIDIAYFALVDLDGFVTMIDAVGGVDITVVERIYDETYPNPDGTFSVIDIQPGTYHMDGETALQYARSRHSSDDFGRMGRQRCVLEALAREADPLTLIQQLPTFVPAIEQSVLTDIPLSALPDFIELAARVNTEEIVSIRFMPNAPEFAGTATSYIAAWNPERYPIPDRDFIAATVHTALDLPPLEAIRVLNLLPLEDACGPPLP